MFFNKEKWLGLSLAWLLSATAIYAQTFDAGYQKYTRGDFKGAETALQAASKKGGGDKAKIFKFLGISQYMQGKKSQAKDSLAKAVSINPSISISSSEVLDESIIGFFSDVKRNAKSKSAPERKTASAPAKKPEPPKPQGLVSSVSSPASQGMMSKFGKPTKSTYLLIRSNVSTASVMLDGILSGTVGSPIEADPGQALIELEAPGYVPRKIRMSIIANRENSITINLDKVKPKAPPVAKVKPQKDLKKKKDLPENLPDPGDDLFGDGPDMADKDSGGRDLAAEFSADAVRTPVPAPKPKKPAVIASAALAKAPEPAPVTIPPPATNEQAAKKKILEKKQQIPEPKPGYSAPNPLYLQQQPYPQNQPYAYQPQPGMQQPQTQGQYLYQPNPNAPPPVLQQPQMGPQPQYAQPYAPPSPPPPPNQGGPVIYSNQQAQPPPQAQQTVKQIKPKRKTGMVVTHPSGQGSIWIALLPFGAGQFQNENYFLGSAFAGAEVGSIYWYYKSKTDADAAVRNAEDYFNSDATTEDKKSFEEETNTFVDNKRKQQNYGLYGFGILYAVGVVEAIINMPESGVLKRKPRAITKKLSLWQEGGRDDNNLYMQTQSSLRPSEYHVGIVPMQADPENPHAYVPMLGASATWEF